MDLTVSNSAAGPVMNWGAGPRRCAIGPHGMGQKKEGDGKNADEAANQRRFEAAAARDAQRTEGEREDGGERTLTQRSEIRQARLESDQTHDATPPGVEALSLRPICGL